MPWAKLDDQYPDHPKIVAAGPLGMALHTAALCYCARYLTDGFVPAAMIARLISLDGIFIIDSNGVSHAVSHKEITDGLTRLGLFDAVEGGFIVHDYLEYNPPAAVVKAERAENAKRQAEWREKKRGRDGKFHGNAVSNAVTNDIVTTAPSPSPSIINTTTTTTTAPGTGSDIRAEKVYRTVTGNIAFPSGGREDAIGALRAILAGKTDDEAHAYLMPFWKAWTERHYSRSNFGWLTDWAVCGSIPEQKSAQPPPQPVPAGRQNGRRVYDPDRESAEERKRRYGGA